MAPSRSPGIPFRFYSIILYVLIVLPLFVMPASCAAISSPPQALQGDSAKVVTGGAPSENDTYLTDLPYRFTLSAVNKTPESGSNSTGMPLVLGQDGASTGVVFHYTSTFASFPYDDYPSLNLTGSTLKAYTRRGQQITNGSIITAFDPVHNITRNALYWYTSTMYNFISPKIFSVLMPNPLNPVMLSSLPLLAVYGDTENWSLCAGTGPSAQINLYYNVTGTNAGGCYGVWVNAPEV